MKTIKIIGTVLVSPFFVGCVSQGKYDRLSAEHEALLQVTEVQTRTIQNQDGELSSLARTKQALEELARRKAEMDKELQQFKNLTAELQAMIDTGSIKVTFRNGRMVVSLGADVLFKTGSARLSPEGVEAIAEVSRALAQISNKDFQVEGHTDDLPIKNRAFASNWQLAAARAYSVLSRMQMAGLPTERVSMASYAETQPTAPNDSAENRALNRRIDIVIVPDLSKLVGVENIARDSSNRIPASESPAVTRETEAEE